MTCVAGPGIAPGLGDYEPPVQLYTTPRHVVRDDYISFDGTRQSRRRMRIHSACCMGMLYYEAQVNKSAGRN